LIDEIPEWLHDAMRVAEAAEETDDSPWQRTGVPTLPRAKLKLAGDLSRACVAVGLRERDLGLVTSWSWPLTLGAMVASARIAPARVVEMLDRDLDRKVSPPASRWFVEWSRMPLAGRARDRPVGASEVEDDSEGEADS
jgi:hypothetical protein